MKIPMYDKDGRPTGDLEVPDEVLAAAQALADWGSRNSPDDLWQLMGLGLVGPHVARAKLEQTNHIKSLISGPHVQQRRHQWTQATDGTTFCPVCTTVRGLTTMASVCPGFPAELYGIDA